MIHKSFADRAIRDAFRHPDSLREFLFRVCPELPANADYAAAEHLDREFYLEDLEKREPDLVIRVPVPNPDPRGACEFFVIVEHQSRPQQRIAYRIAQYCLMLWRLRLRSEPNPSPFRLPRIIPILLHTHPPAWASPPQLEDLVVPLPGCEDLRSSFTFRYLDVPTLDTGELLVSGHPFDLYLSILPIGPSTPDHCEDVLSRALLRLETLMISRDRFMDLVRSMLQWTYSRQGREHRNRVIQAAADRLSPVNRSLTLSIHEHVAKTLDDELIESCSRSYAEGVERGEERGEANGTLKALRANLLTVLKSRFGGIPLDLAQRIETSCDAAQLKDALVSAATTESLETFTL